MTLKVMILDDEFIILDGLTSFPWDNYNCEVITTAQNGVEGLQKLKVSTPDLILSDIRMPGMDGLVFAQEAKKILPNVCIIFITGYDNFEFAQTAIRVGVRDYLLKPIDFEDMKELISKVTKEIRSQLDESRYFREIDQKYKIAIPKLKKKFTYDLLEGHLQDRRDIERSKLSLGCTFEKEVVVVGRVHQMQEREQMKLEPWLFDFVYSNICEEIFGEICKEVLHIYDAMNMTYNTILIFQKDRKEMECLSLCESACAKIQRVCRKYCNSELNFGISLICEDELEISNCYRQALIACNQGNYLGTDAIVFYYDIANRHKNELRISEGVKQRLLMNVYSDKFDLVKNELRQIFSIETVELEFMKFAAMDLLINCMKYPVSCIVLDTNQEKEWNFSALQDGFTKIDHCINKEELERYLYKTFELLVKQNRSDNEKHNHVIVDQIVTFIKKNYAEDLSLDDLANQFHISKTYIGRLLKTYLNRSFIDILTDQRLLMAEEKIREGKYKEYEVAEQVGYRDFSYFIKVFKRRYGVTPNEFKKIYK